MDAEWEPHASKPRAALCQLAVRSSSTADLHVLLLVITTTHSCCVADVHATLDRLRCFCVGRIQDFQALDLAELKALLQGIFRAPGILKACFAFQTWQSAALALKEPIATIATLSLKVHDMCHARWASPWSWTYGHWQQPWAAKAAAAWQSWPPSLRPACCTAPCSADMSPAFPRQALFVWHNCCCNLSCMLATRNPTFPANPYLPCKHAVLKKRSDLPRCGGGAKSCVAHHDCCLGCAAGGGEGAVRAGACTAGGAPGQAPAVQQLEQPSPQPAAGTCWQLSLAQTPNGLTF